MSTPTTAPARRVTCRYLDRNNDLCTGEVLEEGAEIELCLKHLGRALELFRRRAGVQ